MQDIICVFARFFQKKRQDGQASSVLAALVGGVLGVFSSSLAAESMASGDHSSRSGSAKIAIVIDDLGNQPTLDEAFVRLPGPVGLAFLPHAPATERLARLAHQSGKPVLLHLPMQGSDSRHAEAHALDTGMSRRQLQSAVRQAIRSVPFVQGINNHQGSRLTASRQAMDWLMDELSAYPGLYFLDSRTTADSLAEVAAQKRGVPTARRHVFLDNTETPEAIRQQLHRLARMAHREGHAIAIGHPNPATLKALQDLPSWLESEHLQLVSPAQLMR